MNARSLVFDVPDPICGWGRLVRTAEGDWLDPPLTVPLAGRWGQPQPPSNYAIPVDGADFDTVARRLERDGVVEGFVGIVGRWLGDRIEVHRQLTDLPEPPVRQRVMPPCRPPADGWLASPGENPNPDYDIGELEKTGAAVMVAVFRPSTTQAVLVVAADDVAAVEAHLRPQLPDQLCVVPSRCTHAQLQTTQQHVRDAWRRWQVYGCGRTCDQQGQAIVTIDLVRVTDEIADWTVGQPARLIELRPCLSPIRNGGRW